MTQFFICFCVAVAMLGSPLAAQTVELSTRTFWLGERPETMDSEPPFIAVRQIDWIEAVLASDPVMKDAVFRMDQTFMSVAETDARPYDGYVLLNPDRLPPKFYLPDYLIFGAPVATTNWWQYKPVDPTAGIEVWCSIRDDGPHISLCDVNATYPPDDHIRLKARLFFPPDPADAPTYFRDLAERMRDIAYCLDVTDELIDVPVVHPTLSGCRPEQIS